MQLSADGGNLCRELVETIATHLRRSHNFPHQNCHHSRPCGRIPSWRESFLRFRSRNRLKRKRCNSGLMMVICAVNWLQHIIATPTINFNQCITLAKAWGVGARVAG